MTYVLCVLFSVETIVLIFAIAYFRKWRDENEYDCKWIKRMMDSEHNRLLAQYNTLFDRVASAEKAVEVERQLRQEVIAQERANACGKYDKLNGRIHGVDERMSQLATWGLRDAIDYSLRRLLESSLARIREAEDTAQTNIEKPMLRPPADRLAERERRA